MIDHSYVLLIVMQEFASLGIVYVQALIKTQSNENRHSMKWTVRDNMYDQSTRK